MYYNNNNNVYDYYGSNNNNNMSDRVHYCSACNIFLSCFFFCDVVTY